MAALESPLLYSKVVRYVPMYKMIVYVTQVFETVEACDDFYEEISGELRNHPDIHINGQIVTKLTGYSPEHPDGHEVEP